MSFVEVALSAYGLQKGGSSHGAAELRDTTGDACDKMDDKEACKRLLLGRPQEDDQFHRDGIRWVSLHLDLMRRTQADTSSSRWNTIRNMVRAVPGWMWYPICVVLIIAALFALMLLAVCVRAIKNPAIGIKLAVLGLFSTSVLAAYWMLPV